MIDERFSFHRKLTRVFDDYVSRRKREITILAIICDES